MTVEEEVVAVMEEVVEVGDTTTEEVEEEVVAVVDITPLAIKATADREIRLNSE